MTTQPRTQLLCLDDEPQVLEGLGLHLRRRYDMLTATNGFAALELLSANPAIAVIISDMRMPQMDGALFLSRAREVAPDAVRILLTGQTDLDSAVAAVNEGQIFRFLTKPASPPTVQRAVEAAVEQHRLITSERELLEHTLIGCAKALSDVLALANPIAFSRSNRIKQLVAGAAARLELTPRWQLEMAAMFSQLGTISLPEATIDRVFRGQPLSSDERAMVVRSHALSDQLLGNIPRLETVRAIIAAFNKPAPGPWQPLADGDRQAQLIKRGAELLRAVTDLDTLEAQGHSQVVALDMLRAQANRYDPSLLDVLASVRGGSHGDVVREVPATALGVGMVFLDDVKLKSGMLLVGRGYEVTASFVERIRNHADNLRGPFRVLVRAGSSVS